MKVLHPKKQAERKALIDKGICPQCADEKLPRGYMACTGCRKKNAERSARRRHPDRPTEVYVPELPNIWESFLETELGRAIREADLDLDQAV